MKRILLFSTCLVFLNSFSQLKGKVVNINNNPIPFVNIYIQNENSATTSEENGDFLIKSSDKNKTLVFTVLGYESKTAKAAEDMIVVLQPSEIQLKEVVIPAWKQTKTLEIGVTNSATSQAFDNGPKIEVKFFPYDENYKKTKYIKQVVVNTDSKIEDATFKIHFYGITKDGFPGKELLQKDFIATVKMGLKKTTFNLLDFDLRIPKSGLFVGIEKMFISKNIFEKTTTDFNTNTTRTEKKYSPMVLYDLVEREFQFVFSGGTWNKSNTQSKSKSLIYEPAIRLILTN